MWEDRSEYVEKTFDKEGYDYIINLQESWLITV
jgi:hypothetical protein